MLIKNKMFLMVLFNTLMIAFTGLILVPVEMNVIYILAGVALVSLGGSYIIVSKLISEPIHVVQQGIEEFFMYLNRERSDIEPMPSYNNEFKELIELINKNQKLLRDDLQQDLGVMGEVLSFSDSMRDGNFDTRIYLKSKNPFINYYINSLNNLGEILLQNAKNILQVMEDYSNGNYTSRVDTDGLHKYLFRLSTCVNNVGDSTTKMLIHNKNDGHSLGETSKILLENVGKLNNSSNSAAAQLEETAASLEEMTANITANVNNVIQMSHYAKDLTEVAQNGQQLASKTTQSMDEIDTQVTSIAEAIVVIDQIAFQTNILSLNAAVEAATAGEAGKGFAVVAQEVRNLATRSADAANEIKSIVEQATLKTSEGKKISLDMIKGYTVLSEDINKTMSIITQVKESVSENKTALDQINDAITSLDQQTQQNAQVATQTNDIAVQTDEIAKEIIKSVSNKKFIE